MDIYEQRQSGIELKELGQLKQDMQIPAIPPTISTLCRVIQIQYEIKVEVKVKGSHVNPSIRLPITIGTVPLAYDPYLHSQPANNNYYGIQTVPNPTIMPVQNYGEPIVQQPIQPIALPIHNNRTITPPNELRKDLFVGH